MMYINYLKIKVQQAYYLARLVLAGRAYVDWGYDRSR